MRKVSRTREELLEELAQQLDLLKDAIIKINSGDLKYSKTIAAILRILVIQTRTNNPLLFNTASYYSFEPKVVIDSPFGVKTVSLRDHLKELYFASGTEKISMSNEEFIKIASQQDGGSHVDDEIDFGYQFSNNGIVIGGLPPKVYKLRILGNHVLKAGNELLELVNSKKKSHYSF